MILYWFWLWYEMNKHVKIVYKHRDCRSWVRTLNPCQKPVRRCIGPQLKSVWLRLLEKWQVGHWTVMLSQCLLLCNKATQNLAASRNSGVLFLMILLFRNSRQVLLGSCALCIKRGSSLDCIHLRSGWTGTSGKSSLTCRTPRCFCTWFSPTPWSHHPVL